MTRQPYEVSVLTSSRIALILPLIPLVRFVLHAPLITPATYNLLLGSLLRGTLYPANVSLNSNRRQKPNVFRSSDLQWRNRSPDFRPHLPNNTGLLPVMATANSR